MTEASLETLLNEECLRLLRDNKIGRIAFLVDALPVVLPVNYRLVESHGITPGTWIALRTRPGNVIDRASVIVAFEIDGIDTSHRQGWSCWYGELRHVDVGSAAHESATTPTLGGGGAGRLDPYRAVRDQRAAAAYRRFGMGVSLTGLLVSAHKLG